MNKYIVVLDQYRYNDEVEKMERVKSTVTVEADTMHVMAGVLTFVVKRIDESHTWKSETVAVFAEGEWDYARLEPAPS